MPSTQLLTPDIWWNIANDMYREPGLSNTLIAAQDSSGENVNLALLAIYLQRQGCALSDDEKRHLADAIESFNTTHTQPLRALRRQLSRSESLTEKSRKQLKESLLAAELILEQEEQRLLIEALNNLRVRR